MIQNINAQLKILTAKYPIDYLQGIGSEKMPNNTTYAYVANNSAITYNHDEGVYGIFQKPSKWSNPKEHDGYVRSTTLSAYKNTARGVTTHEYGHLLHAPTLQNHLTYLQLPKNERSGNSPVLEAGRLQERLENLYKKACKNGDVKRISRYAASSPDEFFAECFAYRENGGKLPRDYEKVLDNIIQFATKKP